VRAAGINQLNKVFIETGGTILGILPVPARAYVLAAGIMAGAGGRGQTRVLALAGRDSIIPGTNCRAGPAVFRYPDAQKEVMP